MNRILVEEGRTAEQKGNTERLQKIDALRKEIMEYREQGPASQRKEDSTGAKPSANTDSSQPVTVTIEGEEYTVYNQEDVAEIYAEKARQKGHTVIEITPTTLHLETREGDRVELPVPQLEEV